MAKICYIPVIAREEDLNDAVSRAAWFLSHCQSVTITIPVASGCLRRVKWSVASGMDKVIAERFNEISDRINIVHVTSATQLEACIETSDILLKWDMSAFSADFNSQSLKALEAGKKVWSVDPQNTRMEGSFYIDVGLHLLEDKQSLIRENKQKFETLTSNLGKFKRAYVMATGPSVWRYRLYDYNDAISIVCNSVILDDELMARVNPEIVVFADPVFHFGPSQYAAAFRQRLREVARIYNFTIVIPFKYYGLFISTIPELRNRTIAVPFAKDRPFNFNIGNDFEVKTTANILTLLLIPLATTFADEIGILGCDGRPLSENTYFWGHNQKTQINDKMANIRVVHPAFFAIDYNDYYLEHCETLETQFRDGERAAKRFESLGFSHIPALHQRIEHGPRQGPDERRNGITRAFILDPDAKSWTGHYMAYNEKLSVQLENQGLEVDVICREDLDQDILSCRQNYHPTFSAHSWEVGNRAENSLHVTSFEAELDKVFAQLTSGRSEPVLVYMYCGSLSHAEVLSRLSKKYPQLFTNINLFWLSFTLTQESANEWKTFITWLDEESRRGRFMATLPTKELRDELAEYTGCILPVAPHPSTGFSDDDFQEIRAVQVKRDGALKVVFPSAPRPEKGYATSIACAQMLAGTPGLDIIIRHAPTFSTPKHLAGALPNIPKGVEIVEGELSEQEFHNMFTHSNIIVLPYSPEAFSKRTSGLLIDSIYHGIPCVVVRGTWLAKIVERYGCGEVVAELSAGRLSDAVGAIARNYEMYRARAINAGEDYFLNNSWRSLGQSLLGIDDHINFPSSIQKNNEFGIMGCYRRDEHAHWDETKCIAELFKTTLRGSVMVDVGAHHGSALMPFLSKGWHITAFEPDEKNRKRLEKRISDHAYSERVCIDHRCVSNASETNVAFFRSDQSTGISGLSAFHESHVEAQRVDTTTLTEWFRATPGSDVDFLKIDTEGHDLFVLQGFPWDQQKPAVIECEFEDSKTEPLGYTFHDLACFLVDKGYTVYVSEWHPIVRYGIRHDWNCLKRYPCELSDPRGWGNLLAFRDPIDENNLVSAVQMVLKVDNDDRTPNAATPSKLADSVQPIPAALPVSGQDRGFRVEPGFNFSALAPNQWRYTQTDHKHKLWVAAIEAPGPTAGRSFSGCLRVMADRAMTVNVSLGRHGKSEYEGTAQRIILVPGVSQTVKLSKRFEQSHVALKLQIEVLDLPDGASALMDIDGFGISESLLSICTRLADGNLDLRTANRLFREGDYTTALGIYLWLGRHRALSFYDDNAVAAARRAGMPWVKAVNELKWIMEPH